MSENPAESELRDMIDKGMTLYQISRLYKTTIPEIFQLEKEYGIIPKTFVLKKCYNISKEDMELMYIDEHMSQRQIAEELGYSDVQVCRILKKRGIQARVGSSKYTAQERSSKIDDIVRRYNSGETQEEIAEKVGYSRANVSIILHECGVQIRGSGRFTPQQRASISDEIVERYNNGETTYEIAEEFGYTPRYVGIILHERGVQVRGSGKYTAQQRDLIYDNVEYMYKDGMTAYQIAEEVGYTIFNVYRILYERGVLTRGSTGSITSQKMSIITADKLQECIDKGMNQSQIAEHFGVSDATIYRLAEKFGIPGMVEGFRHTTPEYQAWRYAVLDRDHRTCQMCGKTGVYLEVHHIIPWADAPEIRYNVDNGVPLCHECHKNIKGHEYEYAQHFLDITQPQCRDHDIIESMPWEPPLELHSIIDYPEEKGVITS